METVDMKVNVASSRWSLAKHHVRIYVVSKSKNSEILSHKHIAVSNTVTK